MSNDVYTILQTRHREYDITVVQKNDTCHVSVTGTGEPYTRLSIAIDQAPPPGCFWLKGWSENEHLVDELVRSGSIELVGPKMRISQYVSTQAARLVPKQEQGG